MRPTDECDKGKEVGRKGGKEQQHRVRKQANRKHWNIGRKVILS